MIDELGYSGYQVVVDLTVMDKSDVLDILGFLSSNYQYMEHTQVLVNNQELVVFCEELEKDDVLDIIWYLSQNDKFLRNMVVREV